MAKGAAALGLFLLILISFTTPAATSPDLLEWTRVNVPADGENGDWGLAWGSDIQHLTAASDGTLYACVRGLDYGLYSSDNGGYNWQARGKVTDDIVAIATDPDDASLVYYATTSRVYESDDGAESFFPLPESPGGAGDNNIEITSLDISRDFAKPETKIIAVGTRDKDGGEFGGVYLLKSDNPFAWSDAGAFATMPAPLETEAPPEPPPEPQSNAFDWTEWLMPMGGIMFLVFTLVMMAMLVTMIILVIKVSKL